MSIATRSTYHHGHLRSALIEVALALLDEGGPEAVGLREAARRVGVSPTATYRHFRDKEALLAAVATEGFRGFAKALGDSVANGEHFSAMGRAYVDFALAHPGLFRLMFSPLICERRRFPELGAVADEAFAVLRAGARAAREMPDADVDAAAIAAWALAHGLAHLLLDGVLPIDRAPEFAETILRPPKRRGEGDTNEGL